MLQVPRRLNQAGHLFAAQEHRQGARQVYRLHAGHQFRVVEGDVEEELQSTDRGVQRGR